jgi:hypothetical protein
MNLKLIGGYCSASRQAPEGSTSPRDTQRDWCIPTLTHAVYMGHVHTFRIVNEKCIRLSGRSLFQTGN